MSGFVCWAKPEALLCPGCVRDGGCVARPRLDCGCAADWSHHMCEDDGGAS